MQAGSAHSAGYGLLLSLIPPTTREISSTLLRNSQKERIESDEERGRGRERRGCEATHLDGKL